MRQPLALVSDLPVYRPTLLPICACLLCLHVHPSPNLLPSHLLCLPPCPSFPARIPALSSPPLLTMEASSFSAYSPTPASSSSLLHWPGCHLAQAPSRAPPTRTLCPASCLPPVAPPSLGPESSVRKWARLHLPPGCPACLRVSCLRPSPATCLACSHVQPAWITRSAWLRPTAGRE